MGAHQQVVAEPFDVFNQSVDRRPRENVGPCHNVSQGIPEAGQFLSTPGHEFVLKIRTQSAACVRWCRHHIDDSKWRSALARDLGSPLECGLRRGGGVNVNENARECVHRLDPRDDTAACPHRCGVADVPRSHPHSVQYLCGPRTRTSDVDRSGTDAFIPMPY
jgi:hypothetical protein